MLITCGEEILTLVEPNNAVFNIFRDKVSDTDIEFVLLSIWTVSHPNTYIDTNNGCPISSY
jgi:hypothetical protein